MGKSKRTLEAPEISDETVIEVIRLARLDPDAPSMANQIGHFKRILAQFRVLSQVEVASPDAPIQSIPTSLPLRKDETGESLDAGAAMDNAANRHEEFFKAPRVPGGGESDPAC